MKYAQHQSPVTRLRNWFAGIFTGRNKALSAYRDGMAKANRHDHQGAINDYTKTIESSSIPPDVKAMVLYNRALVYLASGEDQKGTEDLNAVLSMDAAPLHVKSEAKRRLLRIRQQSESNG